MNLQMAGWEETIEALSYVEIIVTSKTCKLMTTKRSYSRGAGP